MLNHGKHSDLTAYQYELLGRNFIEWSNIEFLLGILLSRLLLTPEFLGRTYSDEMSAAKLESAIKNAVHIHRDRYDNRIVTNDLCSEIDEALKLAAEHRAFRNKLAHYLWMRSSDDQIFGSKMSGKLPSRRRKSDSLKVSSHELRDKADSAHLLVEKLKCLIIDHLPKTDEEHALSQQLKEKSQRDSN